MLMLHVDNKNRVGKSAHLLDTAQTALQFVHHASAQQCFFFGEQVKRAVLRFSFQIHQSLDGLSNGFVIRQHAAQPALVNIGHAHTGRLLCDHLCSRTLRANEEYFLALGRHVAHFDKRFVKRR